MIKMLLIILGVIFAGLGLPFLIKGVRELVIIKSGEVVKARVAEIRTQRARARHNGTALYYMPVYEYAENGVVKRFESGVYSGAHKEVGSEVTLYKSGSGRLVENRNTAGFIAFGAAFLLGGICCICGAFTVK